jgi:hypothetical protein
MYLRDNAELQSYAFPQFMSHDDDSVFAAHVKGHM